MRTGYSVAIVNFASGWRGYFEGKEPSPEHDNGWHFGWLEARDACRTPGVVATWEEAESRAIAWADRTGRTR